MAWFIILVSYLIGAIPCGYLIGRWGKNIDLRRHGSGNIGTTNAFRILGPRWGMAVLLGDVIKGAVAVWLAIWLVGGELFPILAGLVAIIGHNWPVYLGFRGGRGVATAAGVILALAPLAVLGLFIFWIAMVLITRYVSVASMSAAIVAPFILGWLGHSWGLALFGLIAGAFVFYRHLPNLERLRHGVEPRIGKRRRWI